MKILVVDLSEYTVGDSKEQLPPVVIDEGDLEASKTVFGWE